jgi:hypothetical protein
MPDGATVGAAFLVAGPAIATICLLYPPFWRVWTVAREEHLALVAAHRLAWTMANVGFTFAAVLSAAGLVLLALSVDVADGPRAVLVAGAVAYAIGGSLWCAVLAIRNRTTPALARMVADGSPTEPAETLLGSAMGGLFATFMLTTAAALVAVGATLALSGVVAAPIAWLATLIAAAALGRFITSGDVIPAVVYFPTLLLGIALLVGRS